MKIKSQTITGLFNKTVLTALLPVVIIVFTISCSVIKKTGLSHAATNSTYENSEAKTLSDSIDNLLNRISKLVGQKEINLTLGVVKDGQVF